MVTAVAGKAGIYEVVSPLGKSASTGVDLAPHLPDLNGKTICEIRHTFRSDETFPMLERLLRQRFPAVKFVSNAEIRDIPAVSGEQVAELTNVLRQKGCDALLSGNGG